MTSEGKVAVISGASRGIGREIALELARGGYRVGFNYVRNEERAAALRDEIAALGSEALGFRVDISQLADVREMVKAVKAHFGRLDVVVNNAGIIRDRPLMTMSEEDWDAVLSTNLKGAFNLTKAAITTLMKQKSGCVLNISSISGLVGMPGQVNYAASKAGLIGFTKALAKEVGRFGVRVNVLALGFVDTDMLDGMDERYREEMRSRIPLQRFATAREVARLTSLLLSDATEYITGQVIVMDGGLAI